MATEITRDPAIHQTCEGSLHAQRGPNSYSKAYRKLADRNRAAGQLRKHGWTVTLYDLPPCHCGLPNALHYYDAYPESFNR